MMKAQILDMICWSEGGMLRSAWQLAAEAQVEVVNCQVGSNIPPKDWQTMPKIWASIMKFVLFQYCNKIADAIEASNVQRTVKPVSYTHLTLPTKLSV